ncbi:MAG TPA: spore cortex biosynthesis protein YabQ [Clostridia bacterium]|nr:spore cortex biosynthesis protein YabQ [Clostridia bacterium]
METVQFQSYVFSYTVYGGILIGVLYDIYRVLKGKKRNERLITSFWDMLFLFSVFTVVIWAVFSSSYGDIRSYVFIGFLVGFYLYEKLLGRIAAGVFLFLYRNIASFFKKTNCIAALPLKLLYSFLCQCYYSLSKFLGRKKIRLRKVRKLPKQIVDDSRKYYSLIVKRKNRKGN